MACEFLSDSNPVYSRCTWLEQLGVDGTCVDAGWEQPTFIIMISLAGALIVVSWLIHKAVLRANSQDMNLKALKTKGHLEYRCEL